MNKHPFLYEINTAVWLHELSRESGSEVKLGDVPEEKWDSLRDLGFDYVWLMGVWQRSKAGMDIFRQEQEYTAFQLYLNSIFPGWTEEDMIGSPYSVAGYVPDSIIGTWEDIRKVREQLNKRNMGLILDFVPNHTAPDHPWVRSHPGCYITGSEDDYHAAPHMFTPVDVDGNTVYFARGKDPFFPPWSDTVQLNYLNPATHEMLIGEMMNIGRYCDGIRCDMAMLVTNEIFAKNWGWTDREHRYPPAGKEFWERVRKAVPGHLLIAEAYWDTEWTLQQMGFDFVYDKTLYDRMKNFSSHELGLHLKADIAYQKKLLRFIENHDEARSRTVFTRDRIPAAALILSTVPGMKLFYQGQMEGRTQRTPVQLRRAMPEEPDGELRRIYKKILSITRQDVFRNGEWQQREIYSLGDNSYLNLLAWSWKSDNVIKLVVVNLGGHVARAGVPLPDVVSSDMAYIFYDELNEQEYLRKGSKVLENGLPIILDAHRCHVFDIKES